MNCSYSEHTFLTSRHNSLNKKHAYSVVKRGASY